MTLPRLTSFAVAALVLVASGCNEKSSSAASSVVVAQLAAGDAHCPAGGVSVTTNGTTAYACAGADGLPGAKGDPGLPGAKGDPGIQGLTGATGGGYYVSRANVYCDTRKASTLPGTDNIVWVQCRANNDLPLHGSCAQGDREDVTLAYASSDAWMSASPTPTQPAAYRCQWSKGGFAVTLATIPSATAEICCVVHP